MPNVTVADTTCLIIFYKIGELELLKKLFGKLHITDTVLKEFNHSVPDWIEVVQPKTEVHKGFAGYLDPGEATSIALASEYEESLLIIDEIKGRKAAKDKGHLKAVKPVLEKIQETNFRISKELIGRVLEKVNES